MKKYVDTDALIENIAKIKDLRTLSTKTIGEVIANTPAADVVEVVKCKHCKHWCASYCTRDIKVRTNMYYRIVCEALKKGVRPEFFGSRLKDVKQKRGKNLTPEERHKIVRMYIEGMSQAQIARILGKSPSLINKVIKREWEAHKW